MTNGTNWANNETNKLLLVIIAILIPPLAVGLKRGLSIALIVNIVLTLIFYIPGLIHALWVVLR
ncbi:MAG: YqaE/Pmp3 family membrane protein [Planctomycetota bacterium]|nr:YqaE/Pmp3 family membrane protein [Planctomycetota bacterium]